MRLISYQVNLTGRGDKLIVLTEDVIYVSNHNRKKITHFANQLKEGQIPTELTGIPVQYIRNIKYSPCSRRITIEFKKSSEDISFGNVEVRDKFIDSILTNFPGLTQEELIESNAKYMKWYVVGLLLTIAIIVPAYNLAVNIENNPSYRASPGFSPSFLGGFSALIGSFLGPIGTLVVGFLMLITLSFFIYSMSSVEEKMLNVRFK